MGSVRAYNEKKMQLCFQCFLGQSIFFSLPPGLFHVLGLLSSLQQTFLFLRQVVCSLSHFGNWSLRSTASLDTWRSSLLFIPLLQWFVHPFYTSEIGLKPVLSSYCHYLYKMMLQNKLLPLLCKIGCYFVQVPMTNTEVITQENSLFEIQELLWRKHPCGIKCRILNRRVYCSGIQVWHDTITSDVKERSCLFFLSRP